MTQKPMRTFQVYGEHNDVEVQAEKYDINEGILEFEVDNLLVASFAAGSWNYVIKQATAKHAD
jgi:hypothetical protein